MCKWRSSRLRVNKIMWLYTTEQLARRSGKGEPGNEHASWKGPDNEVRPLRRGYRRVSYTIFEGTSEIQRLVIARTISGLHIP